MKRLFHHYHYNNASLGPISSSIIHASFLQNLSTTTTSDTEVSFDNDGIDSSIIKFHYRNSKPIKNMKKFELDQKLDKDLNNLKSREISNIIETMAKLKYDNYEKINKISKKAIEMRHCMNEIDLSSIFCAWKSLNYRRREYLDLLAQEMMHDQIIMAIVTRALSSVLCVCAQFHYYNFKFIFKLLDELMVSYRLASLTNSELINIINAIATLSKCDKEEHLLNKYWHKIINRIKIDEINSPKEICKLFLGCACVNIDKKDILKPLILKLNSYPFLNSFTCKEFSLMLWSMGKLNLINKELLLIVCNAINKRLKEFNNHDLSQICIGLSYNQNHNKSFIKPILKEIMSKERLYLYDDQQLSNILWAISQYGIDDNQFYGLMLDRVIERLSTMIEVKPKHLLIVIKSMCDIKLKDKNKYLNTILEEVVKPKKIMNFKPDQLRCILSSLRKMEYYEKDIYTLLEDALPERNLKKKRVYMQRQMDLENKKWPKLFTIRKY